jgi:hypothetical protein
MFVNSDFGDLLSIFNARNVRYLIIGGYAGKNTMRFEWQKYIHADPRS